MPFKSKAQRRKFAQLLVEGKISDETYEEWNRETGRKELPERVTKPRSSKTSRSSKAKLPRKTAAKKSRSSKAKATRKRSAKKARS